MIITGERYQFREHVSRTAGRLHCLAIMPRRAVMGLPAAERGRSPDRSEITDQMELRWHGARTLEGLFARATAVLAAHAPLLTQFAGTS